MPKKETKKTEEVPSVQQEKKEKEEVKVADRKESTKEVSEKREVPVKKETKKAEEVPSVEHEEKKALKEERKESAEQVPQKKEVSRKVAQALEVVKGMGAEERSEFGVSMIKELNVLELSEWVKTLEKEFGVSAQAPVAVAAAAPAGAPAPAEEEQKDSYTVMLTSIGDKKIQVIKEVRSVTSLGLREAKALVDEAPKAVKEGVSEKEANEVKAKLEAAGATVELK